MARQGMAGHGKARQGMAGHGMEVTCNAVTPRDKLSPLK